jgi:hypothetical protein
MSTLKDKLIHYARGAAAGALAALLAGAPNTKALAIAVLMGLISGLEQSIASGGK